MIFPKISNGENEFFVTLFFCYVFVTFCNDLHMQCPPCLSATSFLCICYANKKPRLQAEVLFFLDIIRSQLRRYIERTPQRSHDDDQQVWQGAEQFVRKDAGSQCLDVVAQRVADPEDDTIEQCACRIPVSEEADAECDPASSADDLGGVHADVAQRVVGAGDTAENAGESNRQDPDSADIDACYIDSLRVFTAGAQCQAVCCLEDEIRDQRDQDPRQVRNDILIEYDLSDYRDLSERSQRDRLKGTYLQR